MAGQICWKIKGLDAPILHVRDEGAHQWRSYKVHAVAQRFPDRDQMSPGFPAFMGLKSAGYSHVKWDAESESYVAVIV